MPSMANLTLNDHAGLPVTAVALSPSAGDTVPAQWRVENGTPPFVRPTMNLVARSNAKRDVRRVSGKIVVPYAVTDSVTGVLVPLSQPTFTFEFVMGQNVPAIPSEDLVAFIGSYFQNPVIIDSLKAAMAPT